ncbi:MAG: SAM-dependent chlorinase/fluorinase [Patescibacteria group bacterium]|nr:SAM-dependent chlorinase/fluorinase [Patescibacteria group bacterium]
MTEALIIQLIADYGIGDPAFAEVIQKLTYLDRSIRVSVTSVPSFSTVATGIWIAQFSQVNAFSGLTVFANTAPRRVFNNHPEKTDGGRLVYTRLANGTNVISVNAGYCLSFIKNDIKKLFVLNVANEGSQFRSRDYYPDAVVNIANGENKYVGEEISTETIPDPPENLIGFIDGYGNLKTTLRQSQNTYKSGSKVRITCNNITHMGVVADETYKVNDQDLSFGPGSTGNGDRFMEIWVRNGNAWKTFNEPRVEQEFKIEAV